MIALTNRGNRTVANRRTKRAREELRSRTRRALSLELGFVPNSGFREMDLDGFWKDELRAAELESETDAVAFSIQSGIPAHLARMCGGKLLTAEEERDLFCRMNYLKFRANSIRSTLNVNRPSIRKLDQIDRLLQRSDQLRNRIVSANTRLVVSIVKRFADERNNFDELLSEGLNSLIRATDKFDFDRGFRFSTYATMAIRREVFRIVQRSQRDRTRFATGAFEVIGQQLARNTDRSEATMTHINRWLDRAMRGLDEREQYIVKARFGLIEFHKKPSFANLGEQLGVSKERVRQLEIRAMDKLRTCIDDYPLPESIAQI